MLSQPAVAIVLLNYNNLSFLQRNLHFFDGLSYQNFRLYIIDNASTDQSVAYVANEYPHITIIPLSENKGYAGGYNEGLKHIQADYFVLLNTDVEVTADFLEPVLELMEKNKRIGICHPKILSIENRDYFEYAGGSGGYMDELGYTFARGRILDHKEKDEGQYEDKKAIFWASGACFIIRASLFFELKGFYGYYFMYCEEVDLCWRAHLSGHEVYVCPQSVIYHRETDQLIQQRSIRIYYLFRNNLIMLHRNLPFQSRIVLIPFRVLLNCVAAIIFLLKGKPGHFFSILKTYLSYLKWAVFERHENNYPKKKLKKIDSIYKGSILKGYYLQGKKTYKDFLKE